MARRGKAEGPVAPAKTADQLRLDVERLRRRIAEVEAFDPDKVTERWAPAQAALQTAIDETLRQVFAKNSVRYQSYRSETRLDNGPASPLGPPPLSTIRRYVSEGKARTLAMLGQAVKTIEEEISDLAAFGASEEPHDADSSAEIAPDEIFIVHGHDVPAKTEVARLIERAGLKAVILHGQANAGRTIIEKFEAHGGSAGFAVVLLTPDDVGGIDAANLKPRARQNVIGELFWFAGTLGRSRVCALKKGEIEMPSDFLGIIATDMDDRGAWKAELLRELEVAGYAINWAKAMA